MAFIRAKWSVTDSAIYINADHILAVYLQEGVTVIQTSVSTGSGAIAYEVADDLAQVLASLHRAIFGEDVPQV